jgi:hypothetical protein
VRDDPSVQAFRAVLEGLLTPPHEVVVASPTQREGALAWLLAEAERELAYLQRLDDPRYPSPPGSPSEESRRSRTRAYSRAAARLCTEGSRAALRVHLVDAELAGPRSDEGGVAIEAALAIDPSDVRGLTLRAERELALGRPDQALAALEAQETIRGDRALLLYGRALRELGRPKDAIRPLLASMGRWRDHRPACLELARTFDALGADADAQVFRERAALLAGSRREEATTLWKEVGSSIRWRDVSKERLAEGYKEVLALDPLHYEARVALGKAQFGSGEQRDGLIQGLVGSMRKPSGLPRVFRGFLGVLAPSFLNPSGPSEALQALTEELPADDPEGSTRLARAYVLLMRVETQGEDALLPETEALLAGLLSERPAVTPLYAMRAFCSLRQGFLAEAERDLELCQDADPGLSLAAFYRALHQAARGESEERVLEALERSRELGYSPWRESGWSLESYPELADYLHLDAFRPYRSR